MTPKKGPLPMVLFFVAACVVSLLLTALAALSSGLWTFAELSRLFLEKAPFSWAHAGFFGLYAVVAGSLIGVRALGSLQVVKLAHVGMPVTLGERSKDCVLTEGWYWLPPFTTLLAFDNTERQLALPLTEVLSADNVPIRFKGQLQTRIVEPYPYSNVTAAEKMLEEQTLDACRVQISSHTALEVALAEDIGSSILKRLAPRSRACGIATPSLAITELRLPPEIERYAQVIRLIRKQHPDISARYVLDALQADTGSIRKLVFESSSVESAASAIATALSSSR